MGMSLLKKITEGDMPVTGASACKGGVEVKTTKTDESKVPFVDLKAQYAEIKEEVDGGIKGVLDRCDFILGESVKSFEKEFAAYCGAKYCAGVASGTDALHLSLKALGIKEGDEVITQANTFIATLLAISYTGAAPVLVDIDPATYNIDANKIEAAITGRTKAIVPVHLYGRPADMDEIRGIAAMRKLFVVEDACQAHGAYYYGGSGAQRAGTLGDIAAFSFYPGKNLGAYGDGGAVTTDSNEIFERVRMLRDYGQQVKYHHVMKGYNSRLDTIQAAVLSVKLRYLDRWNELRAAHARRYAELLNGVPEIALPEFDASKKLSHVFHLFVIRVRNRTGLMEHLCDKGITTGIHYPVPNHLQKAFIDLGYRAGSFPITEKYADEILSLPMFPELKYRQIEHVAETIKGFYKK